jgi:hypothetical protein
MNAEMMELQSRLFAGIGRDQQRTFFAVTDKLLVRLRAETSAEEPMLLVG